MPLLAIPKCFVINFVYKIKEKRSPGKGGGEAALNVSLAR